ncbi:right-handed parallel beta-helix repeat-containing protein [Chengkuizengella sp. SCS-71B]|uniref:right-handed parallel beta-helix repeat-containing protein n=1 Tax=Chengkuizengella sp. SCS-71B TaxID=3115290 RepID=UPI0032C2495B
MTVINVPNDHPTIQAAEFAAMPGDEIEVEAPGGPYMESVTVSTNNIIIRGIMGTPVVQPGGDFGFFLDGVTEVAIDNFNVRDFNGALDQGILLSSASECTLQNITVENNFFGIFLDDSNSNIIENNIFENNNLGVLIENSNGSILNNNTIKDNNTFGIVIDDSNSNTVKNNALENNKSGLVLDDSNDNTVKNNTIKDDNDFSIVLVNSNGNTVKNNTIKNNNLFCIVLEDSNDNTVENNVLENNESGIFLSNSSLNMIKNNTVQIINTLGISQNSQPNFTLCDKTPDLGVNCYQVKAKLLSPEGEDVSSEARLSARSLTAVNNISFLKPKVKVACDFCQAPIELVVDQEKEILVVKICVKDKNQTVKLDWSVHEFLSSEASSKNGFLLHPNATVEYRFCRNDKQIGSTITSSLSNLLQLQLPSSDSDTDGILLDSGSNENRIENNTVCGHARGITVDSSIDNTLKNNEACDNTVYDISVDPIANSVMGLICNISIPPAGICDQGCS